MNPETIREAAIQIAITTWFNASKFDYYPPPPCFTSPVGEAAPT